MNIYQRINAVRMAVGYVQKDKKVEGAGYMAVTHDAVTALLRPALIEQGIIVTPSLVSSRVADTGAETAKKVPYIRYEGTYDVTFVNADDPADRIVSRIEAHAVDQGDKAPGKAISYAVKYAMLKLFSLETGDDDEGRADLHASKKEDTKPSVIKPTDGARERVSAPRLIELESYADEIRARMKANDTHGAYEIAMEVTDADEGVAMWSFLDRTDSKSLCARDPQERARVSATRSNRKTQGAIECLRHTTTRTAESS